MSTVRPPESLCAIIGGCSAPDGPSTPFGDPGLLVIDSIRILVISTGVVILIVTPWTVGRAGALGQRSRMATFALMTLIVMSIEVEHFGDWANWRLAVVVLAMVGNAWGIWAFWRWELPAPVRRENGGP